MAKRRLRGKIPELKQALHGRVTEHHRFLLRALLEQIEFLEGLIARFDARIEEAMAPFAEAAERLRAIPGVGEQAAEVIMAEVGTDMTPFPTAGHLSSWAGLCPGNDQSAGKRRSGKTTKGSQWLRTTLVQVGLGGQPHQGDDLQCVLSSLGEANGEEEGAGRGRPQDPRGRLSLAEESDRLP